MVTIEDHGDGFETASEGENGEAAEAYDQYEDALNEEDLRQRILVQATGLKNAGNAEYSAAKYTEALASYGNALQLLDEKENMNEFAAICRSNRAMCYIQMNEYEEAIKEASKAIELNPNYYKAFIRRAQAHEKLDNLEDALTDMQKARELEPRNEISAKAVEKLQPLVEERREKLKEEMIGKLKGLGNSILGRFGMSVDNFKTVKDPVTGTYSISYQQEQQAMNK